MHGSVHHTLKWDVEPEEVQYDPMVVIFAEGTVLVFDRNLQSGDAIGSYACWFEACKRVTQCHSSLVSTTSYRCHHKFRPNTEGLIETKHPYHFVARKGFKDLLNARGAGERIAPLVHRLVPPIRATLISKDMEVYEGGISGLLDLSNAVCGARFQIGFCTRRCHWIPRMFA
jgi:hypothetical protein